MPTIVQRLLFIVLLVGMIPGAALSQWPDQTQSNQGVGQEVNNAGHSTQQAAQKTAHKVKRGAKKGAHRAAEKTREGASYGQDKTEPRPSQPQQQAPSARERGRRPT